jgi:hypothetical protein
MKFKFTERDSHSDSGRESSFPVATMGDKTANRKLESQFQTREIDLMTPVDDLGFLVVKGSNSHVSQGDGVTVSQILCRLKSLGVRPERIRAFASPVHTADGSDYWPSACLTLRELKPPGDYLTDINLERSKLNTDVVNGVRQLLENKGVKVLVFIYLDHGDQQALGPLSHRFSPDQFLGYVYMAMLIQKRILFVLGTGESTAFAERLWQDLSRRCEDQERKDRLAASVGFVMSTPLHCLTTAIIVSAQDDLVYLCHPDPQAREDGLAVGYRIRNSMFGRQLLDLWSYRLRSEQNIKLRDFPALLNSEGDFRDRDGHLLDPDDDGLFCNGFMAAFVGATAEDGCGASVKLMGDCLLNDFLPLLPIDPDAPVPNCQGATYGQFIPREAIGELDDDMRKYRGKGDSSHTQFKRLFIEMTVDKGVVKIVDPVPRVVGTDMRPDHPIAQSVGDGYLTAVELLDRRNSQVPPVPKVPWREFSQAISRLARKEQWHPRFREPTSPEWHAYGRGLLETLNGELPCSWDFVYEFDEYARLYDGNLPEFETIIGAEYDKLYFALHAPPGSAPSGESAADSS